MASLWFIFEYTHMATFILQLPMAQEHLARFDPGVLLLLVQVLQLVDVILTLGFTFLQVYIRKNSLNYQYLKMIKENKSRWSIGCIIKLPPEQTFTQRQNLKPEGTLEVNPATLFIIHGSNQSQPH